MKICDLSSFYSDSGGGVRTYHLAKAAYFAERPHHRYVLIVAGAKEGVERRPGVTIYRVRGIPVSRGGAYRQIVDLGRARRLVQQERPDVLEFGSPYLDGWIARHAARADRAIVRVGIYHADVPDAYMAPLVRSWPAPLSRAFVELWRRYMRLAYGWLDATIATSRYSEIKLQQLGLRNVLRVPLGTDTALFDPARRSERLRGELGLTPEDRLAVFAGRFHPEKSIPALVAACQLATSRDARLKVLLVGNGPQEPLVRQAAASNPALRVLGYQADRQELARLLASADLYIAPGQHETFGLATLEAMSSGLPVVAAARGGAGDLVREAGIGRLFEPDQVEDLAQKLNALARDDLAGLSRRMRRFVLANYGWERTFDRMVDCYERLGARAQAGPPRRETVRSTTPA